MAKAKTSTEVLKAAKWMLENVGWCQNQGTKYGTTDGKIVAMCANSALNHVDVHHHVFREEARVRLRNQMAGGIIEFNDRHDTTKKDVLAAFNRAIQQEK